MGVAWSNAESRYTFYIPFASFFGLAGEQYVGKTVYGRKPPRACGSSELCTMFSAEWNTDSQALAMDGQYWRSIYGGSRLVLGSLRCEPSLYVVFRLLLLTCIAMCFFVEVDYHPFNQDWMHTFGHWTLIVQSIYFLLSAFLTLAAACSSAPGISRQTPITVRVAELCYGICLPASIISFLIELLIHWSNERWCISRIDLPSAHTSEATLVQGVALCLFLLDLGFSRQPYYSSFHAMAGVVFCWGYLLYNVIWEVAGGHNLHQQTYIYRCLDWSYPLHGGGHNASNKMMFLNLFVLVPVINYLYWLLIWARRRVMLIPPTQKQLQSAGADAPNAADTAAPLKQRRRLFEWYADYRDLQLDGRHWRAQFGGASSPSSPKVGAYVMCGPGAFVITRLLLLALSAGAFAARIWELHYHASTTTATFVHQDPPAVATHQYSNLRPRDFFLYFENWMLAVSLCYFSFAFVITTVATIIQGAESPRAPWFVWITWVLHAMLLPMTLATAFLYFFIFEGRSATVRTHPRPSDARVVDCSCVYGTLFIVLFDAWLNRQPYYATFHGFIGCAICWIYVIFNLLYVVAGGEDENGLNHIYPSTKWNRHGRDEWMTVGKFTYLEFMILLPIGNVLYWCMLWARRRARVAQKQSAV